LAFTVPLVVGVEVPLALFRVRKNSGVEAMTTKGDLDSSDRKGRGWLISRHIVWTECYVGNCAAVRSHGRVWLGQESCTLSSSSPLGQQPHPAEIGNISHFGERLPYRVCDQFKETFLNSWV
jgi:hypothetical protein